MKILLVAGSQHGLGQTLENLRALDLNPIVAPTVERACSLIAQSRPDVVILSNGSALSPSLLSDLDRRKIPTVLVGNAEDIEATRQTESIVAAVLTPPAPETLANAVELAAGRHARRQVPEILIAGRVRIDVHHREVFVDGNQVDLPPIEFAILLELALHEGKPLASKELLGRVWPPGASVTLEDVHRHMYRLRGLIGDNDRRAPLITTRRGFGYVLRDARKPEKNPPALRRVTLPLGSDR